MRPTVPRLLNRHARRIPVKALVVALAFCTVLSVPSRRAAAQAPSNSLPADAAPTDSTRRYVHHPLFLPAIAVGIGILALAPAVGVLAAAPVDTSVKLTWLLL